MRSTVTRVRRKHKHTVCVVRRQANTRCSILYPFAPFVRGGGYAFGVMLRLDCGVSTYENTTLLYCTIVIVVMPPPRAPVLASFGFGFGWSPATGWVNQVPGLSSYHTRRGSSVSILAPSGAPCPPVFTNSTSMAVKAVPVP